MTIPSDISTFMTVLLFPGPAHEAHYTTFEECSQKRTTRPRLQMWGVEAAVLIDSSPNDEPSPG